MNTEPTTTDTPAPLSPQQRTVADTAAALGEGWSCTPASDNPHVGYLDGPDGVRLRMAVCNPYGAREDRNRIAVHIHLDRELVEHRPPGLDWPRMGASPTKSPEQLAHDIGRRLLDAARALTTGAQERKAAHERRQAELDRITASVAATFGSNTERSDVGHRLYVGDSLDPVWAKADLEYSRDRAQVTVHLPPEAVPALAALVAALRAQYAPAGQD